MKTKIAYKQLGNDIIDAFSYKSVELLEAPMEFDIPTDSSRTWIIGKDIILPNAFTEFDYIEIFTDMSWHDLYFYPDIIRISTKDINFGDGLEASRILTHNQAQSKDNKVKLSTLYLEESNEVNLELFFTDEKTIHIYEISSTITDKDTPYKKLRLKSIRGIKE